MLGQEYDAAPNLAVLSLCLPMINTRKKKLFLVAILVALVLATPVALIIRGYKKTKDKNLAVSRQIEGLNDVLEEIADKIRPKPL